MNRVAFSGDVGLTLFARKLTGPEPFKKPNLAPFLLLTGQEHLLVQRFMARDGIQHRHRLQRAA